MWCDGRRGAALAEGAATETVVKAGAARVLAAATHVMRPVSRPRACIGSPCLRRGGHGASIGWRGGGAGGRRARGAGGGDPGTIDYRDSRGTVVSSAGCGD
jgi:hypothetical protein